MTNNTTAGARLRRAVAEERPLQVIGAINAYHAMMAERVGYRALYLSGGGVAAGAPIEAVATNESIAVPEDIAGRLGLRKRA